MDGLSGSSDEKEDDFFSVKRKRLNQWVKHTWFPDITPHLSSHGYTIDFCLLLIVSTRVLRRKSFSQGRFSFSSPYSAVPWNRWETCKLDRILDCLLILMNFNYFWSLLSLLGFPRRGHIEERFLILLDRSFSRGPMKAIQKLTMVCKWRRKGPYLGRKIALQRIMSTAVASQEIPKTLIFPSHILRNRFIDLHCWHRRHLCCFLLKKLWTLASISETTSLFHWVIMEKTLDTAQRPYHMITGSLHLHYSSSGTLRTQAPERLMICNQVITQNSSRVQMHHHHLWLMIHGGLTILHPMMLLQGSCTLYLCSLTTLQAVSSYQQQTKPAILSRGIWLMTKM